MRPEVLLTEDAEQDLQDPYAYIAKVYAAYVRDPDGNKIAAVCRGFTARQ